MLSSVRVQICSSYMHTWKDFGSSESDGYNNGMRMRVRLKQTTGRGYF
jgi:hypothetical protein